MPVEPLVDTIIELVKDNIIAETDITSDAIAGSNTISVYNSFHFMPDQEIILIDYDYNVSGTPHYQRFEYSKIKTVNNTTSITLYDPLESTWLVASNSFVQKTIGHSPLYANQVLFGDREIIPADQMAITVEPSNMSNEWMYLQGGLNEEYKLKIMIYGKDMKTDEGLRILVRYADNVVELLNKNIHIGAGEYSTPLLQNVNIGDTQVIIAATPENIDRITITNIVPPMLKDLKRTYQLQDNNGTSWWFGITNIDISGNTMILTMDIPMTMPFLLSEFAVIRKPKYYVWDSRADSATYGVTQKGSAILRAAEIGWYGKMINEFSFPQPALNLKGFNQI